MEQVISMSAENFIKTIYKFEDRKGGDTKSGSIAKELGITHSAATDMARKLSVKKLVDYKKYKDLQLTPEGKKMALAVIRKHRLWETFLHEVFGLTMHEIHREAELLEHSTSDFMAEKINLFLGNPTSDPHGDPIPDKKGLLFGNENCSVLSMAKPKKKYEICRLSSSDKEFFDFCQSNQITVGSLVTVKNQYIMNRMTEIEINKSKLLLNWDMANIIFVKELEED